MAHFALPNSHAAMQFWYTARQRFGPAEGLRWAEYVARTQLNQLRELVTLDLRLCPPFFDADEHDSELWQHVVMEATTMTSFYTDLPYLLSYTYERQRFNLLATLYNPDQPVGRTELEGFEFMGYDLLDEFYEKSALIFPPIVDNGLSNKEYNPYGLLPNFDDADRVREFIFRRSKVEFGIWAVWRHRTVGRLDLTEWG